MYVFTTSIINRLSIIAATTFICLSLATNARAWVQDTSTDCPGGIRWASDQTFYINTVSFETATKQASISEPGLRFNTVGDQWFDFTFVPTHPTYTSTSRILANPLASNVNGVTAKTFNTSTCRYTTVLITMNSDRSWAWGAPLNEGEDYWDADRYAPDGDMYIRPVMAHELMHAVGFSI